MKTAMQLLRVEVERWPLRAPFRIAGHTWEAIEVLVVHLEQDGLIGRSEAAGIYYKSETPRGQGSDRSELCWRACHQGQTDG